METDISRASDRYEPVPMDDYQEFQQASQFQQPFQQFQPQLQPQPQQQTQYTPEKKSDFFADIDKKAWILILVALILGFFMGKTMQPIILKTM
jgi:hypothetical protein